MGALSAFRCLQSTTTKLRFGPSATLRRKLANGGKVPQGRHSLYLPECPNDRTEPKADVQKSLFSDPQ